MDGTTMTDPVLRTEYRTTQRVHEWMYLTLQTDWAEQLQAKEEEGWNVFSITENPTTTTAWLKRPLPTSDEMDEADEQHFWDKVKAL